MWRVWLVLFLVIQQAALGASGQGSIDNSSETRERLIGVLQRYRVPEPGPISVETAVLQRQILNAPLEQLPPDIRAGYILRQVDIYDNNADWEAFERLVQRVTSPEWPFAPEDAPIHREAIYRYTSVPFAALRQRAVDESEIEYGESVSAYWQANLRDLRKRAEIARYAVQHGNLRQGNISVLAHMLVSTLIDDQKIGEARDLFQQLSAIPESEYWEVSYYHQFGNLYVSEIVLNDALLHIGGYRRLLNDKFARAVASADSTTATLNVQSSPIDVATSPTKSVPTATPPSLPKDLLPSAQSTEGNPARHDPAE